MIQDIVGTEIKLNDTVVTTHNGRIILGRISKIYEDNDCVQVSAIDTDTGGRRPAPKMKPFRRYDYNVFVVNDGEVLVSTIKGFMHNTGEFDDDDEEDDE
jgi:hypothetical protein